MKRKIIFIINPISGTVNKANIPGLISMELDKDKFDYEIAFTEYAGHATLLAKEAADKGVDIVVAAGGDGTINEIGRSIVNTHTAMAIIPCGSGNGLARHLQIPINPKRCIDIINSCDIRAFDYGLINNRPFFCTCGMGFDAFISMQFAKAGKRGMLTYVQKVLEIGLNYQPEVYLIDEDNRTEHMKAFLISAANASQYGNNAYIAPRATMQDGLLDITIIEPFGALDAAQVAIEMFNKTLDKNLKVKTFRTKHIHIQRQNKGVIHFDGEPVEEGQDIDISVVPQGIRILVPKEIDEINHDPNKAQNALSVIFSSFGQLKRDISKQGQKAQVVYKALIDKLKL